MYKPERAPFNQQRTDEVFVEAFKQLHEEGHETVGMMDVLHRVNSLPDEDAPRLKKVGNWILNHTVRREPRPCTKNYWPILRVTLCRLEEEGIIDYVSVPVPGFGEGTSTPNYSLVDRPADVAA